MLYFITGSCLAEEIRRQTRVRRQFFLHAGRRGKKLVPSLLPPCYPSCIASIVKWQMFSTDVTTWPRVKEKSGTRLVLLTFFSVFTGKDVFVKAWLSSYA